MPPFLENKCTYAERFSDFLPLTLLGDKDRTEVKCMWSFHSLASSPTRIHIKCFKLRLEDVNTTHWPFLQPGWNLPDLSPPAFCCRCLRWRFPELLLNAVWGNTWGMWWKPWWLWPTEPIYNSRLLFPTSSRQQPWTGPWRSIHFKLTCLLLCPLLN